MSCTATLSACTPMWNGRARKPGLHTAGVVIATTDRDGFVILRFLLHKRTVPATKYDTHFTSSITYYRVFLSQYANTYNKTEIRQHSARGSELACVEMKPERVNENKIHQTTIVKLPHWVHLPPASDGMTLRSPFPMSSRTPVV